MIRKISATNIAPLLLLFLAVLFSGCGYKLGNMGHPQLKSVAIAPVVNDTLAYNASAYMRGLLAERFQVDGTMKLTGMTSADCIVYSRITKVTLQEVAASSTKDDDILPNQWAVTINVEYSVVIPGKQTPLVQKQQISGKAEFMSGPDIELSRNYAIKQACFDAAKNIVAQVTEAW